MHADLIQTLLLNTIGWIMLTCVIVSTCVAAMIVVQEFWKPKQSHIRGIVVRLTIVGLALLASACANGKMSGHDSAQEYGAILICTDKAYAKEAKTPGQTGSAITSTIVRALESCDHKVDAYVETLVREVMANNSWNSVQFGVRQEIKANIKSQTAKYMTSYYTEK